MAVNLSSNFAGDIKKHLQESTLALAQKQLVLYKLGEDLKLPNGVGTTYTATRYERLPLPTAPLLEGQPPSGRQMSITQVTGTVNQWGDLVSITDKAKLTIYHDLVVKMKELMAVQAAETLERNTAVALLAAGNINYVNSRGSRAALLSTDVFNTTEINRAFSQLNTAGVLKYGGPSGAIQELDAANVKANVKPNPETAPHYVAVTHPFVQADLMQDSTFSLAASRNDISRFYTNEFGQWSSVRFLSSNMVPYWTGAAAITGTAGTAGTLATGSYYIQVTASDTQNQYESLVYQVSAAIAVTGPTGSVSVVLPALPGYTYNVYIGTTTAPANLGSSVAGPTTGSQAGQAVQLAPGQTVVITNVGVAQSPPAAPTTGITVYPIYIFGREAFGQVKLRDIDINFLGAADKSDPMNQTRVASWNLYYGTMIMQAQFLMRVEASSAFNSVHG